MSLTPPGVHHNCNLELLTVAERVRAVRIRIGDDLEPGPETAVAVIGTLQHLAALEAEIERIRGALPPPLTVGARDAA